MTDPRTIIAQYVTIALIARPNASGLSWDEAQAIGVDIARRVLDPEGRLQRALDYLDAVDRLDSEAARRISGLPLYSASPEFRAALMNVLAYGAAPPEYPGLALVPQGDLERLRSLAQRALGVESKEEGS